ncbi:MAG TPA: hypothetical protein VLX91_13835 [Candidatus Acidoferrales bacterium]|nr:hypothetical protein [Candidatus Acidoferrales bacterium]
MKALFAVLGVAILFVWFGCSKNRMEIVSPNHEHEILYAKMPQPFGNFGMDGSLITSMGPSGYGWAGIITPLEQDDRLNFNRAKAGRYVYIIGLISRDSVVAGNWASVASEIAFGQANGVGLFYVDDAQSDQDSGKVITKPNIDYVASLVHAVYGDQLITGEWNLTLMQENPGFYQNVDGILPYNYAADSSHYAVFMRAVQAALPTKNILPCLGYHADIPGSNGQKFYPDQVRGFIALAEDYTTYGLIIYYCYPFPTDYTYTLTSYLQHYKPPTGGQQ